MASSVETTNGAAEHSPDERPNGNLPPIAAAFYVRFDDRKGYVLAWHHAVDNLKLEGVVEFKSLPSGLHNVKEDLVYFVHEDYAGISAFLNREDDHAARKARMIAVGVMVPIEHGRMGKSWLHAEGIKDLAKAQVEKQEDYSLLEGYWDKYKIHPVNEEEDASTSPITKQSGLNITLPQNTNGYRPSRSMSTASATPFAQHTLAPHHPALALLDLLHTFGPLIFPLFRALLLRKRILLLCEAPVEKVCNFVYNLSILSSLPREAASLLSLDETADLRLQPIFNVGVSDIPQLMDKKSGQGWIACTTDDVLCTKTDLFDLLVIMPDVNSLKALRRGYPKLVVSSPELSKAYPKVGTRASQRDARRFRMLWKGLQVMPPVLPPIEESAIADDDNNDNIVADDDGTKSIASSISSTMSRTSIVEPQSWSRIAYTSLIWWASAGDKRAGLEEAEENEADQDASLLDLQDPDDPVQEDSDGEGKTKEVAIVAYFHRLSAVIFAVLGDCVHMSNGDEEFDRYRDEENFEINESASPGDGSQSAQPDDRQTLLPGILGKNEPAGPKTIDVRQQDVSNMGLDVWSASDRKFIEEMISFWWGQQAVVHGGRVECCGLRII